MTVTTPTRSVAGMLPGPDLAFVLAGVDLSAVDEFEVVEVLKAGRRPASWAAPWRYGSTSRWHTAGRSLTNGTPVRLVRGGE